MKKQSITLATLFMAAVAITTSCSSEQLVENSVSPNADGLKTYTVVINASKPGNDSFTRAIADAGTSLTTSWNEGEKVYAYIADTGDPVEYTVQTADISTTDAKKASLTFTFTKEGGFAQDDQIVLYYLKPKTAYGDYDGQVGTLADIAANFDFMKATATVTVVDGTSNADNILAYSTTNFVRQQAITKFTVQKKTTADPAEMAVTPITVAEDALGTLTVTPASASSEIWMALPGAATSGGAEKAYKFEATNDSKLYGVTKSVALVNNKYYTANLAMGRDIEKVTIANIPDNTNPRPYNGDPVSAGTVSSGDDTPNDLTPTDDYDVTYKKWNDETGEWDDVNPEDVKDAGQYKVIVTGKGEYEGTTEQEFTIDKMPEATVQTELADATKPSSTPGSTDTYAPSGATTDIVTGGITGLTAAEVLENSTITIEEGGLTPAGSWASINEQGQLVVNPNSGGIVTVTIALGETANHEAATITKTYYVKQTGTDGTLPDPGEPANW